MLNPIIYSSLLSIVVTFILLIFTRAYSVKIGFVDAPDNRKRHIGNIPLTGGISMFFGFFLSGFVFMADQYFINYMLPLFMIMLIGLVDDYNNVSARLRIFLQGAVITLMIFLTDVSLNSFGSLIGDEEFLLENWSVFFTIVAVLGVINSLNMVDGIDGLASGQSLITLLFISYFSYTNGDNNDLFIAILFCSVIIPFLWFNLELWPFKNRRVFMGDAGSMFLGLGIAWLLVDLSQGLNKAFSPVTALWIFSVPLIDTITIVLRRVFKGQSPFKPDRNHLHHIIARMGYSDKKALVFILLFSFLMSCMGLVGEMLQIPEWKMFSGFLLVFMVYYILISHIWKVARFVRQK
jgi:UDP-GlcNAc:undecaprenyl-phosphate GlcNAc-1-phosphate transferase